MLQVLERLHETSAAVMERDDRSYLNNIVNRWVLSADLWRRGPNGVAGVAETQFTQFLNNLHQFASNQTVTPEWRAGEVNERQEALRETLARYDVRNTPVEDLQEKLNWVCAIWERNFGAGTPGMH